MLMRGYTTVTTRKTDLVYTHKYNLVLKCGKHRCVIFRCIQHKHQTCYHKWYMFDRTTYTYTVAMTEVDGSEFKDYHAAHYPQLCSMLFSRTTYPHRCAVNAYIDWLHTA